MDTQNQDFAFRELGAVDYISKPVVPEKVLSQVHKQV